MGVDPEFEWKAASNGWLQGDLPCRPPIDEDLVVGVDEHGGLEASHDGKDVDAVPSPSLCEDSLRSEETVSYTHLTLPTILLV